MLKKEKKENKRPMSVAIEPALRIEVIKYAERKGLSYSAYISNILEQATAINIDDDPIVIAKSADDDVKPLVLNISKDDNVTPVVLKIPNAYKENPEKLRQWLDIQSAGILKAIIKQP